MAGWWWLAALFVTLTAAGLWLRYVLGKGWPLLSTNPEEVADTSQNLLRVG